jgi:hypothetical protein
MGTKAGMDPERVLEVLIDPMMSTGDIPCYSTNVASRTDTPQARSWLQGWLDQYPG